MRSTGLSRYGSPSPGGWITDFRRSKSMVKLCVLPAPMVKPRMSLRPVWLPLGMNSGWTRAVVQLDERVRRIAAGIHLQADRLVFAGGQHFIGEQDFAAAAVEREQVDLPRREVEDFGSRGALRLDLEPGELHDDALGRGHRRVGDPQVEAAELRPASRRIRSSAAAGGEHAEHQDANNRSQDRAHGGGGDRLFMTSPELVS